MKNITQHTGRLTDIQRLPSSANGNPRYSCKVDGHSCRTAPDSSDAYSLSNHEGDWVTADIGTYYGVATVRNVRPVADLTPARAREIQRHSVMGEHHCTVAERAAVHRVWMTLPGTASWATALGYIANGGR